MTKYEIVQLGDLEVYRIRENYLSWLLGIKKSKWVRVCDFYAGRRDYETISLSDARHMLATLKFRDLERMYRATKLWSRVDL